MYVNDRTLVVYVVAAAKRCSHVVLVWLHLERCNKDLFATVTGSASEDEFSLSSEEPVPADPSVTAGEPSSEHVDAKAKADPLADWEAQFRFKECRIPQDSLELRERIEGWRHECKIDGCSSRGKVGKGEHSCEHTFPSEFRPEHRDSCARCGTHQRNLACSCVCLVRWQGVDVAAAA